jgi:light-regulated signal transduction histidine kinase (bacteriophytochrome)
MMRRTEVATDLTVLCQAVAQEVQSATGYDRVMVYQFQADDSGYVLAEARGSSDV